MVILQNTACPFSINAIKKFSLLWLHSYYVNEHTHKRRAVHTRGKNKTKQKTSIIRQIDRLIWSFAYQR